MSIESFAHTHCGVCVPRHVCEPLTFTMLASGCCDLDKLIWCQETKAIPTFVLIVGSSPAAARIERTWLGPASHFVAYNGGTSARETQHPAQRLPELRVKSLMHDARCHRYTRTAWIHQHKHLSLQVSHGLERNTCKQIFVFVPDLSLSLSVIMLLWYLLSIEYQSCDINDRNQECFVKYNKITF